MGVLSLVDRLADTTEAELIAARSLNGEELRDFDQQRSDLLFELKIALQDAEPLESEERGALAASVARLRAAEERLERIARTVLGALSGIRPVGPVLATYARSGAMRG